MQQTHTQLKEFLDKKSELYNNHSFIETDPIQIPHAFTKKEDIEISAFLAATLAWGQRQTIIKSSKKLLNLMDNSPFDYILNASENDLRVFEKFVHRTFQGIDCIFFLKSLQNIYKNSEGLEYIFTQGFKETENSKGMLSAFRIAFLMTPHLKRSEKHIANVLANASAKRLNMFLRWMVRNDDCGVDFGIWNQIPTSALMLPLDIHTGNVARNLGLLSRNQNDWYAVEEVTANLRNFDSSDPIKYDFALFGIGAFEK